MIPTADLARGDVAVSSEEQHHAAVAMMLTLRDRARVQREREERAYRESLPWIGSLAPMYVESGEEPGFWRSGPCPHCGGPLYDDAGLSGWAECAWCDFFINFDIGARDDEGVEKFQAWVQRIPGRDGEAPTPPASTESIRGENRTALVRPGMR